MVIWEQHTGSLSILFIWYKTCEQILLEEAHVETWDVSFVVTFKIGVAQVPDLFLFHWFAAQKL